MEKILIDGKIYRIKNSCFKDGQDSLKAAFKHYGIVDMVNALPPRCSNRYVQLFIMKDGKGQIADNRIICEVSRYHKKMKKNINNLKKGLT